MAATNKYIFLRAPTPLFLRAPTTISKSFLALPKSTTPPLSLIRPQFKILASFTSPPPIPTQTLAQTPDAASGLTVVIVVAVAIAIPLSKLLAPRTPRFSFKYEGRLRDPPTPFSFEMSYSERIIEYGPGPTAMPMVIIFAVLVVRALLTWFANIPWESAMRHISGDLALKLGFLLLDMLWHLARRPRSY